MTTCRKTSFEELYTVICQLVVLTTAIPCWRKMGIQAQPNGCYSTVYLSEGASFVQDTVEEVGQAGGIPTHQSPVGLTRLDCRVEFFRNIVTQPALDSAIRFRNALHLESRFNDLWRIAGLVGNISLIDVSAMFRADVEGRAEVRFSMYADVSAPPLQGSTDNSQYDIEHQGITVYRDTLTPPIVAQVTVNKEA